jgi:hypothetical protein
MDLGMQVDPVASAVSISTLAGLGAFMTKMSDLNNLEKQRDGAVESLRKAKALLLAGNLDLAAYERAAADAETLAQEYEAAKAFLTLGQAVSAGSGDPGRAAPLSRGAAKVAEVSRASRSRNEVPQMTQSVLDRRDESRGSAAPQSESPSSPLGDLIFASIMAPLVGLFVFSLQPDSVMESRAAVDPACDPCADFKAKIAKEEFANKHGIAYLMAEESELFP